MGAKLDTTELAARLAEALRDVRPTEIIQMGDFVDLDESAVLEVSDSAGQERPPEKQPLEEWRPVLGLFPQRAAHLPLVGNHERYGELTVAARLTEDDHLEIRGLKLTRSLTSTDVHAALLAHFPHLQGLASFHGDSGSYVVTFPRYCLLSFDGADLDHDPTLVTFLDDELGTCEASHLPAIVVNHYPLFSGRPAAEDRDLELHAYRDRLIELFTRRHAALVLSGHEHFYLRYLAEGRRQAGYVADLPPKPAYLTVSDFANPYSRKLERLDPSAPGAHEAFRYFRGTHYAEIVVNDAGLAVTVRGYRKETSSWETVDAFVVPL